MTLGNIGEHWGTLGNVGERLGTLGNVGERWGMLGNVQVSDRKQEVTGLYVSSQGADVTVDDSS